MMLQRVLESAIEKGLVKPSRIPPLRTAVKQYAAMFGVPAAQLPPEQYHLSKDALFRFIESHLGPSVGPSKLRNTKNNLAWLLALAVQEAWLRPVAGQTRIWKTRLYTHERPLPRARVDGSRWNDQPYGLLLPQKPLTWRPGLAVALARRRVGRQDAPAAFLAEIDAYLRWCQVPYAPGRPAKIQKRAVTATFVRETLIRIGGYGVHVAGIPLDQISLERLTDPVFVQGFVAWWVNERRGRVTSTMLRMLDCIQPIAQYYLKQPDRAEVLQGIKHSINHAVGPVWDKEASLIPLIELEQAGLANHPFSPDRLQRSREKRVLFRYLSDPAHVPLDR
jgi:hypothetical protein